MKFPSNIKVFGDLDYRGQCPPESAEQKTAFNWLRNNGYTTAIHPRNEGRKHYAKVSIEKSEGMTPGASDIVIPGSPAFVCELKRRDHTKSRIEPDQVQYLEKCQKDGCFSCIALGCDAVIEAVKAWQEIKK